MPSARQIAFNVLLKIEQDGAYSNLALNNAIRESKLGGVDSSFVSALVYGVLERQITLDYIIKQYSKIPLRKIEIKTKIILRMGLYQLLDAGKTNFINGILRSVTRTDPPYTLPDEKDKVIYYSVKYSAPQELIRLWLDSYGEPNTVKLCESLSGRPKLFIRVNTLKTDKNALKEQFLKEGVECKDVPVLDNALSLSRTGSIERLDSYKNGLFHVQDLSSQLCVHFLSPQPRELMHDVCSAPGGKAFTAAQYMQNRGKLCCYDLFDHKVKLISDGARRLGITIISAAKRDAAEGAVLPLADKILCDVPCSGLGILSRKPEIRAKSDLISKELPELQYKILCRSAKSLAVGGRLVYSTCTLNPAENGENVRRFLSKHPDFAGVPLELPEGVSRAFEEQPYEITLMPHCSGTDGFYIALLERRSAT